MTRVCADHRVSHAKESLCQNASHFQAIEILIPYFPGNFLQCLSDFSLRRFAEVPGLDFLRQEEEVPVLEPDFVIERARIQRTHHAPIVEIRFTFQGKNFRHARSLFADQNGADSNDGYHETHLESDGNKTGENPLKA